MDKGVTSAYFPLWATAVSRDLYETFATGGKYERLRHVNTFGGHSAGCAVALRNMEIMEEENLFGRSATSGEQLLTRLSKLKDSPNVGDIRGKGLLIGIGPVEDKISKEPTSTEKVTAAISGCQKRGIIVGKNGDAVSGLNNVITLSPPLSITDDDPNYHSRNHRRYRGRTVQAKI